MDDCGCSWSYKSSAAEKYVTDPSFHALVDVFTGVLWRGEYTASEIREAAIFAAMKVENVRIRPLIFDPNNYAIEQGVLKSIKEPK